MNYIRRRDPSLAWASLLSLVIVFFLFRNEKASRSQKPEKSPVYSSLQTSVPDTDYPEIYAFMRMVTTLQELDSEYGVVQEPESQFASNQSDALFLLSFVRINSSTFIEEDTLFSDEVVSRALSQTSHFPKCLTQEDVACMLTQKQALQGFRWNPDRLGFSRQNTKQLYSFAVPLFSKDRKTAILKLKESSLPTVDQKDRILVCTWKNEVWVCKEVKP